VVPLNENFLTFKYTPPPPPPPTQGSNNI
jgi:hypothetical protein